MAFTHYDRLTGLDTVFLDIESPGVHMHVGSVGIFDPEPLTDEDGGVDFDRIVALTEAGLARAPRFRQKLAHTPITGHPVWVDDEHFNLLYHVRHTALPVPGDERRLKRLVGRIMSEKLDRAKPLWELWFVEGLAGGRMAVISKVHHCLIDGISGVDLLAAFMGTDADYRAEDRADGTEPHWIPRPPPTPARLLADEVRRRASLPGRLVANAAQALRRPADSFEEASHTASGFVGGLRKSLTPSSETPFNVPIGPHRRFDWTRVDMSTVRDIRKKLDGTVNDVVLAVVAGAVRRYLADRDVDVADIDFRVFVPVSTRTEGERGKLGNRVTMLVADLPVDEADPRRRFARVTEETRQLKQSGESAGTSVISEISDWTTTSLLSSMSRLAAARRSYNMVVTNVPGPPIPVFLNGARMLETYPLVPLFENQAVGIALFSYDGALYWGFNACWDAVPDLHDFVLAVDQEVKRLQDL